jgi:hypothetical protein
MSSDPLFIERQRDGKYAVKRANTQRPSAVLETQAEAIQRARELSPEGQIHVERARVSGGGSPDKWRKA